MTDISKEVHDILDEYTESVNVEVKKTINEVAKEACDQVKQNAKAAFKSHSSDPYWKSWKVKKVSENATSVNLVIHSKKYRIAHLLEHGHVKVVNGKARGFVQGKPHIKPAEEWAERQLDKRVKIAIEGA